MNQSFDKNATKVPKYDSVKSLTTAGVEVNKQTELVLRRLDSLIYSVDSIKCNKKYIGY